MSDLQHALRVNRRLPMAWASLLVIAGAFNDRGELEHNLRDGLAAVPQSSAIRWTYAYALHYRDALDELEAFVTETLRALPKSDPNYRSMGTWLDNFEGYSLLHEREFHSAALTFTRAIERDDRARLRIGRASAYLETGNVAAAIADLRAALKLRPWDDDALSRLAEVLWEQEKREEAETLIGQAIALAPMYPGHRLLRAYMRSESDRLDTALADLDVARVFGRYDSRVHQLRGEILVKRDPPAAIKALEAARRLSPDSTSIQLSYAEALYRAADCRSPDALALYERMCVEAQSCSPRASALRAMIEDAPCQAPR
jgi:tetratricopeptide (TPR) repeat protein